MLLRSLIVETIFNDYVREHTFNSSIKVPNYFHGSPWNDVQMFANKFQLWSKYSNDNMIFRKYWKDDEVRHVIS